MSVNAGKFIVQVFLNLFITPFPSVNILKYQSGGVIVRTRVVVLIDISALLNGVVASTPGKFVAKLNVPADMNVVQSPVVAQYWHCAYSPKRYIYISAFPVGVLNLSVPLQARVSCLFNHTAFNLTKITVLSAGALGRVTVKLHADISQFTSSFGCAV